MAKVRVGIIGCGGRAGSHIQALGEHSDAEIVAVADVVETTAKSVGERLGVPWHTSHKAMLQAGGLDACWLSVPVFAHGQVELDVIAAGLPFFVEKPVARDLATARRVGQALADAGLWAVVGYQLRYEPGVRQAKAFMQGRTTAVVEGHYWAGTNRKGGWQNDWERSGGQLVEQATHTIDLMRHLVGDVVEVYSQQARRILTDITSPDAYTVSLRFANGAIGVLSTSWTHDPRDWSNANILNLVLDGCLLRLQSTRATVIPEGAAALPSVPDSPGIYDAFVKSVAAKRPEGVLSDYADALATLQVSLAANESARSGRPVAVADAAGA